MRSVFICTGGYLGRIDGETRCGFWCEEPIDHDFDPTLLISIDLAMAPSAAIAGRIAWREVQVDDCYTGLGGNLGGTTLGPRWPELQLYGVVLLEEGFRDRLPPALRPPCPARGLDGHAYEAMSALYWPGTGDRRAGRRYAGHHAVVLEERGPLARLQISPPGASTRGVAHASELWVDLTSPRMCDAGPDSLTRVGGGVEAGPVFLISGSVDAT